VRKPGYSLLSQASIDDLVPGAAGVGERPGRDEHRGATGSRRQREAGGVGGQEISAGRPLGAGRIRLSGDVPLLNVNAKHIDGYLDRALELR
jgi:hypothetical protein